MYWIFIISNILFVAGNIWWDSLGDPRFFYVPLSLVLLFGACIVKNPPKKKPTRIQELLLEWVIVLAAGNVFKQMFYYSPTMKQINDFYWGAVVSGIYIYKIIRQWATIKHRNGGKG